MCVVGQHVHILAESGKYVDVNPFTPQYKAPIVDAAVQYDSPYDGKTYILVLWNAIHVPSMTNNLLLLREAGIVVRDMAKIHAETPTVDDHSITFVDTGFRIPLSLSAVFPYFTTTNQQVKPSRMQQMYTMLHHHCGDPILSHTLTMRVVCWMGR